MNENETSKQSIEPSSSPAHKYPWLLEHCPFCKSRMYCLEQRPTRNKRTLQQYIQTKSVCPHCDFWHITDVPYTIARSIDPNMWLPTPEEIETLKQEHKEAKEPIQA